MDSQLKSIIILIQSPNYNYEVYIENQNLLLNWGALYNIALDKFQFLLFESRKEGKEIIDNFTIIKKILDYFRNDIYFSELKNIFRKYLQLDICDKNNNLFCNIKDDVINEFKQEKENILHKMKKIDELVGNIKIY